MQNKLNKHWKVAHAWCLREGEIKKNTLLCVPNCPRFRIVTASPNLLCVKTNFIRKSALGESLAELEWVYYFSALFSMWIYTKLREHNNNVRDCSLQDSLRSFQHKQCRHTYLHDSSHWKCQYFWKSTNGGGGKDTKYYSIG